MKTFSYKHLETRQPVTNLSNLLDELRDRKKRRNRLNILLSSK